MLAAGLEGNCPSTSVGERFLVILLARVDPGARMNRFYWVHIQPTLLDDIAVVCAWGSRDNLFQQMRAIPVQDFDEAEKMAVEIVEKKISRGYVKVDDTNLSE
jgi:predicted DNA-binding WGR domain protein